MASKKKVERLVLRLPKGYKSASAAEYIAQLDDLTEQMFDALKGIKPAELSWQCAPGHNTIGMLLTHLAIVEVWWLLVATGRATPSAIEEALGMDGDADGMPIAGGAKPPRALAKKTLADYAKLLKQARAFVTANTRKLRDADLDAFIERTRRDGQKQQVTPRWILYHVMEHFSGHYGQILLLRHQYRDTRKR